MPEYIRIFRFLAVGALNTAFGYVSYICFVVAGAPLWIAVVGSMAAAFIFNFITYGAVVFKDLSYRNLPRFLIFYAFVAAFNYFALRVLGSNGVAPLIGQAIMLPMLALICYWGLKAFVFRSTSIAKR